MLFNLKENLRLLKWMAKVRKSKPDYQGFLAIFDKKWAKSTQK